MYKKKISTIAIITVLTISMIIAAIPAAFAVPIDAPTLAPVATGPVGTKITVSGTGATGYGLVEVYWDTLATKIKDGYANGAGAYSIANVFIPEDVVGAHDVIVFDTLSSTVNSTTFTITPEIKLSTPKGLPGDSVTVTGTGFEGTTVIDPVNVYTYLNTTPVTGESVTHSGVVGNKTDTIANVTGTLGNTPIVQNPPLTSITLDVNITAVAVTDDGAGNLYGEAISGTTKLNATGTMNYATGFFNVTIQSNDTSAMEVYTPASADYTYYLYDVTPALGTTTSALGSFSAVIMIPAIAELDYGNYSVTSIDEDGNSDTAILTVDYYVTVTPPTGPTGITVTIAGRIEADKAYEIRFGAASIATGTSGTDGSFTATYVIPTVLPEADYTISVVWLVTKTKTAKFTVTAPPKVVYAPTAGVAGAVITISSVAGFPFSAGANISLYIGTTLVNSTGMDDRFGPTVAFGPAAGSFTDLEFTVPALTPGPYALKVVDEFGASTAAIYTFTVSPTPVTTVALNAASYYQGDRLSFSITTTEASLGTITVTIMDPSSATWWTANTWALTGIVMKRVLYQDQLFNNNPAVLPADAPLGSWNWTVTYTPASTSTLTKATGLFTVAAAGSGAVIAKIDELGANMTALLVSIDGNVATIDTNLGSVEASLSSLDATISGLDGDIATIKTNLGTVQATVDDLDLVVGNMYGDLVTINTTLGTIEGTITDMDGTLATIETDVGTVKLDVAAVQTDVEESLPVAVDMMPVWIAVILSLIAAIAAIFAVVTIRQKIAG